MSKRRTSRRGLKKAVAGRQKLWRRETTPQFCSRARLTATGAAIEAAASLGQKLGP